MIAVNEKYTIPIFKHCLIVSLELKFIKLVKDFFKFLSKISINSIIAEDKHFILLTNIKLMH